ncbi:MFS transporter [Mariniluteicoccus endophyticus]
MTFGAGFLSRPLGGVVFGHFGDRVSRRHMLVISLVTTGACTVAMGLLPTYATIGVLAPVLLVILRTLQGFFMGGEQSGAFLMVTEHAPAGSKAFFGASATAGSPIGSILGILAFQITAAATGPDFLTWGWRIPFLASIVLIGVGLWVRLGLHESPVFKAMQQENETTGHLPIASVLRKGSVLMVAGILVQLGFNQFIFIINSFSASYGTQQLKMNRQDILMAGLWGSVAMLLAVFVASWLADRFGLFTVMMGGALFQVAWAFPYFWLFNTKSVALLYVAVIVAYVGSSFVFGLMAAYFVSLFDPEHRYSGVAMSYNVGAVLGGGLSPFIAQWLVKQGLGSTGISAYILVGGLLSAVGLVMSRRRVAEHFPRRTRA